MSESPPASPELSARVRVGVALAAAVVAVLATVYGFLPVQGYLGLNLIAALEPYFLYRTPMNVFQMFVIAAAQTVLFPFFWYLAYRPSRWLLTRIVYVALEPDGAPPGRSQSFPRSMVRWAGRLKRRARRSQRVPKSAVRLAGRWTRRAYRSRHVPETVFQWTRRWAQRVYFGLCAGFVLVEILLGANFGAKVVQHWDGATAVRQDCGKCHYLFRVFNYNMTASVWEETLSRMARNGETRRHDYVFPEKERQAMLDFLIAVRGYDGPRLVRTKCLRCHVLHTPFETKRTRKEWELAIDRMHRKNPFYLTGRQAEELAAYIAGNPEWTIPDPPPGTEAARTLSHKIMFEQKCGMCHTLDVVQRPFPDDVDWDSILTRMGSKAPSVLSAEDSRALRPLIERARSDADAFYTEFPHASASRDHP